MKKLVIPLAEIMGSEKPQKYKNLSKENKNIITKKQNTHNYHYLNLYNIYIYIRTVKSFPLHDILGLGISEYY